MQNNKIRVNSRWRAGYYHQATGLCPFSCAPMRTSPKTSGRPWRAPCPLP